MSVAERTNIGKGGSEPSARGVRRRSRNLARDSTAALATNQFHGKILVRSGGVRMLRRVRRRRGAAMRSSHSVPDIAIGQGARVARWAAAMLPPEIDELGEH